MKKLLSALLIAGLTLGPFAVLILLGTVVSSTWEGGTTDCEQPLDAGPVVFPLAEGTYTKTSGYGMRKNPVTGQWRLHAGTDYGASEGTPIYAIAPGTVTNAGPGGGYGNLIVIEHEIDSEPIQSAYAHIRPGGIKVETGQRVAAGQVIAEVGSTGNSTGPHLHLEIRLKASSAWWASTDPAAWLDAQHPAHPAPEVSPAPQDSCGPAPAPSYGPDGLPAAPASFTGPGGMVTDPSGTGGRLTARTAHLWHQVKAAFPASTGFCFAHRNDGGEHPKGRACDITPGNQFGKHPTEPEKDYGWKMATWVRQHADLLHVQYVIYQGKIWSQQYAEQGWRTYMWRGSRPMDVTLGHYDHLHISTQPN